MYSVEDDVKLGRDEHAKIVQEFGGEYENRKLQGYVDGIGKNLSHYTEFQQFPYKFTILNNENVWAKAMSRVVNDKVPVETAVDELIARIKEVAG